MPKKKKYYKKRRTYRRKGYHPYIKATAPAVAYVATRAARALVRKYVNTEFKYHDKNDHDDSVESVTNNAQTIHLNDIDLDEGGQHREGNQIKMTSVTVDGHVKSNTNQSNIVKIQLWLEKQKDDSGLVNQSRLYDFTDSAGVALDAGIRVHAKRNLSSTSNFKLLKSVKLIINNPASNVHAFYPFSLHHEWSGGMITKWIEDNVSGAIANVRKGALYLTYQSDQITDNFPLISYVSRVRFIDN